MGLEFFINDDENDKLFVKFWKIHKALFLFDQSLKQIFVVKNSLLGYKIPYSVTICIDLIWIRPNIAVI